MIFLGSKIYKIIASALVICLLGLSNCKPPDEPTNTTGSTVFALAGTIDGKPLQLLAGVNDYYMYTSYAYSNADSVYSFSGKLEKASCQNCGEALEIIITNATQGGGVLPVDINKALDATISLKDPSILFNKTYSINLIAQDSGYDAPTYFWNFGNGDTSNLKAPSTTYNDTTTRNVCLTIKDNKCTKTICNTLKPFEVDKGDSVVPNFLFVNNKTLVIQNTSFGVSYFWDFGDGNTSVAYQPEHLYQTPGTYRVCVSVQTATTTHTYCRNVVFKDPSFTCGANFAYSNPKVNGTTSAPTSKAIIRYTAPNGDVYESDSKAQPAGSFFNILSHTGYEPNEKGENTQAVNVAFKCRLYNTNGVGFKDIEIPNGSIAVAYK